MSPKPSQRSLAAQFMLLFALVAIKWGVDRQTVIISRHRILTRGGRRDTSGKGQEMGMQDQRDRRSGGEGRARVNKESGRDGKERQSALQVSGATSPSRASLSHFPPSRTHRQSSPRSPSPSSRVSALIADTLPPGDSSFPRDHGPSPSHGPLQALVWIDGGAVLSEAREQRAGSSPA